MTEQHVPVERLAAYAAGDLDASAALEVEAHVLLCADCRADADAVQRATAALAALPPVTMPDDVAARVDAIAATDVPALGPAGDVLPLQSRRKRPSFAGVAAVAAGLALAGAISVPLVTGGGADRGASQTALDAGREEATPDTKRLESGLDYTHDRLRDTLVLALSGGRRSGAAAPAAGSPVPTPDAARAPQHSATETTARDSALFAFSGDEGRLDACVDSLAESQTLAAAKVPLLVDLARFEGKPAVVVVFPTETDGQVQPDRVDVWVVGPRCGLTPGDDDVLDFGRFARPADL